ncbi:LysR family transcriptional regulator [Pendulispora brunnea]|uniref:LysR family transcriptional regulator n=1 Tax=Pendulispora brunnea TaxID=2905690 RepID=A0ABZ2KC47_9BACT
MASRTRTNIDSKPTSSSSSVLGAEATADLNALREFVALADTGSFSRAARDLATTPATISKRLTRLEEELGVHLVRRTTRQFGLTEAGQVLYERARQILGAIHQTEHLLRSFGKTPCGRLRVSVPLYTGIMHVSPLLPEFLSIHPDLQVELVLENRIVDIVNEGYDIAIRVGGADQTSPTLSRLRLVKDRSVVCGAPSYFEKNGRPRSPFDLEEHNLLRHSGLPRWPFRVNEELVIVDAGKALVSNDAFSLRDAALRGTGLAYLSRYIVQTHLERGELVEVLSEYSTHEVSIDAVYSPSRYNAAKIRSFIDFLAEQLPKRLG